MTPPPLRWQVRETRPVAYDVIKAPGLFAPTDHTLLGFGRREHGRRFVVIDAEVARLHGEMIRTWFATHALTTRIVILESGEEHKTIEAYQHLVRELDGFPIDRRDEPIIAIGGGVVTDVAGFVAASYRRGVPHIKVPTTLMGYVDAAIGVKTGINFNDNKNRLGSFEPPQAVLLEPAFLRTLPRRHLLNGVCEIIKLAIIRDLGLFEQLETEGATSIAASFANRAGDEILDRAIGGMLAELAPNLREQELARPVDFGHTLSYGLEVHHGERLLHGEAVLLDILISIVIAERRQLLTAPEMLRVFALVERLGIALDTGVLDPEVMWQALQDRVEHRNGRQRMPMPDGLGRCTFLNDVTRAEIEAAIPALHARMKASHEPALER